MSYEIGTIWQQHEKDCNASIQILDAGLCECSEIINWVCTKNISKLEWQIINKIPRRKDGQSRWLKDQE